MVAAADAAELSRRRSSADDSFGSTASAGSAAVVVAADLEQTAARWQIAVESVESESG